MTAAARAARAAVALAARLLPGEADRRRYRAEFAAELHGRRPDDQLRYAAGVLSQTFALRAALGGARDRTEEAGMLRTIILCRVLHLHAWTSHSAPEHGHVRICTRCGKWQGPFHTPDERPSFPVYPIVGS